MRDFADPRSRLEIFLGAGGGDRNELGAGAGLTTASDIELEDNSGTVTNEFGDVVDGGAALSGDTEEALAEGGDSQGEDGSVGAAASAEAAEGAGKEAVMEEEDAADFVAEGECWHHRRPRCLLSSPVLLVFRITIDEHVFFCAQIHLRCVFALRGNAAPTSLYSYTTLFNTGFLYRAA